MTEAVRDLWRTPVIALLFVCPEKPWHLPMTILMVYSPDSYNLGEECNGLQRITNHSDSSSAVLLSSAPKYAVTDNGAAVAVFTLMCGC